MTFVIDIGNTNIVCGVYQDGKLIWHARFQANRFSTSDEYFSLLASLRGTIWDIDQISTIAIASVVPNLTRMWQHMIKKYFKAKVFLINAYSPLGLSFIVEDPGFIGADLVVNAFAAWKKYKSTCIVVDLGTATTIQLVTSKGLFLGAVIAPGIMIAATNLFQKASLLSEMELTNPHVILGTNTKDAVLSGIVNGHAYMIEGFVKELVQQYASDEQISCIATGGISDIITPLTPSINTIDKTLTLDGLYLASETLLKQK